MEAVRTRLAALLDSLNADWTPVDSSDHVALYLLCSAGRKLHFSGRAWTRQSALDFEATVWSVWINAERTSILPDQICYAAPA